ncbi:MAG: biotin transporter BioY [Lachnospiraceae bacterium]|nr:biotin transporter BioY [Lachnospiraceae bacterium]
MNTKTKELTLTALMTAIICVLGPLSVPLPFSPVPISLTMIGIYLAVYAVGMWRGTVAFIVYLLLGLVGLPVFSGFTGGPGKLLGPTGGYLIGFIFTALISGFFIDRFWRNYLLSAVGMILGIAVAYVFGTVWLAYSAGMTFSQALAAGVIPYVGFDLIKIVVLMLVGPEVRKALIRANLIAVCEKGISQES